MKSFKYIFLILIVVASLSQGKAQESVLRTGNWYKLAVSKNGIYKINFDLLKKMGIDPGKIDPRKIKIYGNGGGMLPQANNTERAFDLLENPIYVKGEEDGKFNKEDFILFYGQSPDRTNFSVKQEIFFCEKNLYDDRNYYFLTISETNGKRPGTNENIGGDFPKVTEFDDYVYHELDEVNELKSGREWLGENFFINPEQVFKLDIKGITENSVIKIVTDVMGQSYTGSSFKLFLNDVSIGEQPIGPIPNSQYTIKGRHSRDTLMFNSNTVSTAGKSFQELKYQYIKSSGYSKGYLDYFVFNCKRSLALYGDQTIFLSSASLKNEKSQFEISQLSDNSVIWDITNPIEPRIQPFSLSQGTGNFTTTTTELRKFIAFNTNAPSPKFIGKIPNQNLHNNPTPNLIIVVYPDFKEEAQRFANHRQSHSGWTTVVATTEEVFNEFSSGRKDVGAIRDFTKYLYDKNPSVLKSLILFGRSSYDYKDRLYYNTNFVPSYESRNSLEPLETYSSDDFFGFLEDNEGEWGEDPTEYHTLDIGVGRFPVKTLDEATNIVNKIIDYDTNLKSVGSWRKEIVFVADDGDNNTHQGQSDKLAQKVEASNPEFNTKRIFIDAYKQELRPSGEFSPETNKAIQDAIDRGSIIINYTGHGGEKLWAQEKIFDNIMIEKLDNKTYPLFVTATCEFGRNDDPGDISGAELCVIKKNGGAIGMVTTARPVNSSTNFELNQAFYDAVFTKESNSFLTLGEIFRRTKNNSMSGVSNRNFSLLGDPSMKLAFPEYKVVINEIKNDEGADSLKALSTVTINGQVQNALGEIMTAFNGTIDATLYDKQASFTTLGNENPPFSYKQWYNTIFRGSASVEQGVFEFQFIVPKNIAYQIGKGKLSLYAHTNSTSGDAAGAELNFVVGKSNLNPANDTTPPTINLYMGDDTFVNGGTISSDSYLVANLNDDSGINISSYGIGNSIVGVLDDTETFVLNDYYTANKNDFTSGQIIYRMKGLSPGKHTLNVKAWDTFNNPAEASIHFIVSSGNGIKIEKFGNYPNPFKENTTLFFRHNRAGDDLEVKVAVFDFAGQLLKTYDFSISSSNYTVELPELDTNLDFNKKLPSGLYLAKLVVRSLSDSSKNERVTKLIILN